MSETKQKFEIRHRWTGAILWTGDAENMKAAVVSAVASGADTPDTNPVSKIVLDWLDEWTGNIRAAFAGK